MRLWLNKQSGYWYIDFDRKRKSLKTKDKKVALKKFEIIKNEYDLVHLYKQILEMNQKALREIEAHNSEMMRAMEGCDYIETQPQMRSGTPFASEEEMQTSLITYVENDLGLKNIEQYRECDAGIVDAFGVWKDLGVVVEFKLGVICEKHLGQCLRYLGSNLKPDRVWLIGEGHDKTSSVFEQFKRIITFERTRSGRAKHPFRCVYNACSLDFYRA